MPALSTSSKEVWTLESPQIRALWSSHSSVDVTPYLVLSVELIESLNLLVTGLSPRGH